MRPVSNCSVSSGYEVVVPGDQGCCGALHVHSGDRKTARTLAEKHRNSFEPRKLDRVITNAAGCGAQLKELHHLFPKPRKPKSVNGRNSRTEPSTFLNSLLQSQSPWTSRIGIPTRSVSYDAPCHLMHAQGVDVNPRKLIGSRPESNWFRFRNRTGAVDRQEFTTWSSRNLQARCSNVKSIRSGTP